MRKKLESFIEKQPHRHWLSFPFSLKRRWYRCRGTWVDAFGLSWFWVGEKEDIPTSWLERLQVGGIGLDIGAHRGYWTLSNRKHLPPEARILLLEPDPENYSYLIENLRRNRFTQGLPLPIAAWHSSARLRFSRRSSDRFSATGRIGEEGQEVWAVSVDALVEALALPTVSWMKIDVEGAEDAVLEGSRNTLRDMRPTLWIETHGTQEVVESLLNRMDYCIREKSLHTGEAHPSRERGHIWAEPANP
ncbi:MAG: FkbM family methyltransferase [Bacteroidia bacterium]|nr:FkbM family methyltransferase [Bacteroidia bacterium]